MDRGMKPAWPLLALLALPACGKKAPEATPAPVVRTWQATITADDRQRLYRWRAAFVAGLNDAKRDGAADRIVAEGSLLDPDAALDGPALPAGDYRCRVIKLGARTPGLLSFIAYPAFTCRIGGGQPQSFVKLTGSQRPIGEIFVDNDRRLIFLGTLLLGDESRPLSYGRDQLRDIVGAVERIGPNRWRLVLPYPKFESLTDVIELVPLR